MAKAATPPLPAASVSILHENLKTALGFAARAVASKSTLPVLANVLLHATADGLTLAGTDLNTTISARAGAKVTGELAVTVPAKTLVDLVNTLPNDVVTLTLNAKTVTLAVECQRTKANIKGIEAGEFPPMPEGDGETFSLPADELAKLIDSTVMAAATDNARATLMGVLMRVEKNIVTFAATDGFRVAEAVWHGETHAAAIKAVIPARALTEVRRALAGQELVEMEITERWAKFTAGAVTVTATLLEGQFPAYESIIPKKHTTRLMIAVSELRAALRSVDIFAREAAHTTRLKVTAGSDVEPGRLAISARAAETGDNVASLDASVEGDGLEIAFNAQYLLDALNVIETPNVALELVNATTPGVMKPVGQNGFVYVAMPMHLEK